jgi:hypothetical protein
VAVAQVMVSDSGARPPLDLGASTGPSCVSASPVSASCVSSTACLALGASPNKKSRVMTRVVHASSAIAYELVRTLTE